MLAAFCLNVVAVKYLVFQIATLLPKKISIDFKTSKNDAYFFGNFNFDYCLVTSSRLIDWLLLIKKPSKNRLTTKKKCNHSR